MAYNDIVQAIADAQTDAQTLDDVVNGEPDKQVQSRLGRLIYTLATINHRVDVATTQANQKLTDLDNAINHRVDVATTQANQKLTDLDNAINHRVDVATTQANQKLTDLDNAINAAAAAGAGANGWADTLIAVSENVNQRQINDGLDSIDTMLAIKNPRNGMRVYVKSYHTGLNKGGGMFVYDSSKATINDKGMIINGWVRQVTPTYLNPYNFGALGSSTQNDWDNIAFDAITQYVKTTPYKGYAVHIEYGKYCVISQKFVPGEGYITTSALNFKFNTMSDKSIIVQSDNAILKVRDGLKFGVYNRNTGEKDTVANAKGDSRWYANIGYILNFENVKNVIVQGHIELDGNAAKQILGGLLDNGGFDLPSYGLRTAFVERQYIENVNTHDHLTDGIYIAGTNYDYAANYVSYDPKSDIINPELNGEIRNVTSYRNGRQCLTIAGGRNLSFYNISLYDGGTDNLPLRSMPRAVVDVEAELSPIRDLKFYNCTFKNGGYTAFAAGAIDPIEMTFHDCKFITGSQNGGALAFNVARSKFFNCYFNGAIGWSQYFSLNQSERALFDNCEFTDDPKVNPEWTDNALIIDLIHGVNPIFNNCVLNIYRQTGFRSDNGSAASNDKYKLAPAEFNNFIVNIYTNKNLHGNLNFAGVGTIRVRDFRTDMSEFKYFGADAPNFRGSVIFESLSGTKTNLKIYYPPRDVKYVSKILPVSQLGVYNPLSGKKLLVMGDSITYNANSYANVLSDRYDAELTKVAQDGAHVHRTADGDTYMVLTEQVDSITVTPDVILIAGGVNDPVDTTNLGTMADRTKYTFYGALHLLLSTLQNKFPHARIGYISPIPSGLSHYIEGDITNEPYLRTKAIKEVCAYYSIPVWNGALEFGQYPGNNLWFTNYYMPDGLHPNEFGHIWYANRVEDFVLNLAK